MPENERSLKRNERSLVPGNETRRVVTNRAARRDGSTVGEGTRRSGRAFASSHSERDWGPVLLRVRVEFDTQGIGVDIIKKNLHVKQILPALLLDRRGAESKRRPMLCQFSLPGDEVCSH